MDQDKDTAVPGAQPTTEEPSSPPAAADGQCVETGVGETKDSAHGEPVVKSKEEEAPSTVEGVQYECSWSSLSKEDIVDKVKGVIYGQAIGDALGLATEFMTKEMAKGVYGKKGPSGYGDIYQDFHRSRWDKGDWTDDTDQMLLILQMIVELNGRVDRLDFAKRIQNWMHHGFPEFGDVGGMGIGMTVGRTLSHSQFLTDPVAAATSVWERSGKYLAANGAIMRTSILGVLSFNNVEKVVANTCEIARVTHADPRCSASCVATTTAIALMLQGKLNPNKKNDLSAIVKASMGEGHKVLEHANQKAELQDHMTASSLDKLKLYDQQTMGYTFKALGAGFYSLKNAKNFRDMLLKVIMEGGDADSNGAVCGALMGCRFGFKALPEDLLSFPHRPWLDTQVDKFLETIGLN